MAQVEPSRMLLRSGKQALQPPPKVGSLADVGLGVGVCAAQKKHGRGGRYDGEDVAVTFRAELKTLTQHTCDCSVESSEAGALKLYPEVIPFYLHDATHLVEAGTHAFPDAVPQSIVLGCGAPSCKKPQPPPPSRSNNPSPPSLPESLV